MHWTERRAAKAMLGEALRDEGWTLYGYHEDKSDSMTDYYSPARWEGIGAKGSAVVVVDQSTNEDSGKVPERISYEGTLNGEREVIKGDPWPTYQPNPTRCLWHVEREGVILAQGVGLAPIAALRYANPKDPQALERLVKRIDRSAVGPIYRAPQVLARGDGVRISRNEDRDGIELRFTEKPAGAARDELKARGWRWNRRDACWYIRHSDEELAWVSERFALTAEAVAS